MGYEFLFQEFMLTLMQQVAFFYPNLVLIVNPCNTCIVE